jgi:hypothetical protein
MRPDVCAHQSPAVIDGFPALLGQGGVFRQAIPGLSENASASMPRPRLRAAISTLACDARRSQTGRDVKSQIKSTAKAQSNIKSRNAALGRSPSLCVIPAQAGIQFPVHADET